MSATNGKRQTVGVMGATHVEVADMFMDGKVTHKSLHPIAMVQDATTITVKVDGVWLTVMRWLRNGEEVKPD